MKHPHTGLRFCCYCHARKPGGEMSNITRNPEKLQKWRKILGENFYRNTFRYTAPHICRSHFEYKGPGLRTRGAFPIAMHEEAYKKVMREMEEHAEGIGGEENVEEEEEEEVPEPSESDQSICCCYCGNEDTLQNMTNVPQVPAKFKIWVNILGRQFYQNTRGLKKAYICRAHFPGLGVNDYRAPNAIPMAMKNGQNLRIEMVESREEKVMHEVEPEDLPTTSSSSSSNSQQLDPNMIQCSLEFIIPYVTRCFECKCTAEFLVTRVDFGAMIECNCKSCRNTWIWKSSEKICQIEEEKPEQKPEKLQQNQKKFLLTTVRE